MTNKDLLETELLLQVFLTAMTAKMNSYGVQRPANQLSKLVYTEVEPDRSSWSVKLHMPTRPLIFLM